MPTEPKIWITVPTGSIKDYALLYMTAALQNVDYPPEQLKLVWCITDRLDAASEAYITRCKNVFKYADFPYDWHIATTKMTPEEGLRWGPYYGVILNLHKSRLLFLDSDYDYFWVLGGDNPPPRRALKQLLALNTDVASALIYQRPYRGRDLGTVEPVGESEPFPMFWEYVWTLKTLDKRRDLEPELREVLRRDWIEFAFMLPIMGRRKTVHRNVNFGSGCCLCTRRVMEWCGFYFGYGYHSEDIHFYQNALAHGFETKLDTRIHCSHFDPNGSIY